MPLIKCWIVCNLRFVSVMCFAKLLRFKLIEVLLSKILIANGKCMSSKNYGIEKLN